MYGYLEIPVNVLQNAPNPLQDHVASYISLSDIVKTVEKQLTMHIYVTSYHVTFQFEKLIDTIVLDVLSCFQ